MKIHGYRIIGVLPCLRPADLMEPGDSPIRDFVILGYSQADGQYVTARVGPLLEEAVDWFSGAYFREEQPDALQRALADMHDRAHTQDLLAEAGD